MKLWKEWQRSPSPDALAKVVAFCLDEACDLSQAPSRVDATINVNVSGSDQPAPSTAIATCANGKESSRCRISEPVNLQGVNSGGISSGYVLAEN